MTSARWAVFWVAVIAGLLLVELAEVTRLFTLPVQSAVGNLLAFVFALVFTTILALVGALFIGIYISQRISSTSRLLSVRGGDAEDARGRDTAPGRDRRAPSRSTPAPDGGPQVRIPVVDNGGQWTHREWRVLRDLDVDSEIVPNTKDLADADVDGIVLSGGALSMESSGAPLGIVDQWIDRDEGPGPRHLRRAPVSRPTFRRHRGPQQRPRVRAGHRHGRRPDPPTVPGAPRAPAGLGEPQRLGHPASPRVGTGSPTPRRARWRR